MVDSYLLHIMKCWTPSNVELPKCKNRMLKEKLFMMLVWGLLVNFTLDVENKMTAQWSVKSDEKSFCVTAPCIWWLLLLPRTRSSAAQVTTLHLAESCRVAEREHNGPSSCERSQVPDTEWTWILGWRVGQGDAGHWRFYSLLITPCAALRHP